MSCRAGAIGCSVQVRNLTEDAQTDKPLKNPALEATVLLSGSYAPAPAPQALVLRNERPSHWRADYLYHDAMFHGPRWQVVTSVDTYG